MQKPEIAALALAALGLAVFPVRPGRKEPALRDWQALATTEPGEVSRLFRGGQVFNIGIATGGRSGGFVLDIDRKAIDGLTTLAELENRHGCLPDTWAVETPSGGAHLWFANPVDRRVGNRAGFAPALDIRGDGGFVVAPPSVVGGGSYRWSRHPDQQALAEAPQWLLDLAAPQRPPYSKTPPTRLPAAGSGRLVRYVTTAVVREVQKVESAPEGNGEDPAEEIERRIQAAMIHHHLKRADLEGWLFTGSGRDADLIIAEQDRFNVTVAAPVVDALIAFITEHKIGAAIIDPFVSSHRVAENDNGAIDRVMKEWGRIAGATGCAAHLSHHARKTGGAEVSVEDGRGASALLAAARYARTLRTMNEQEADSLGVERTDRQAYVRIDGGKANLSPPASGAVWFRLANVHLPNGDYVQAASPWTPPDPFEGVTPADLLLVQEAIKAGRGDDAEGWRANVQTGDAWVGHAIGQALGLDVGRPREAARVRELLRTWLASGALVKAERSINAKGKTAPFVEVGRWAEL